MTHVYVLVLALLLGVIAGLRAMTAPAVVSWAAALGWIDVSDTWASWMGEPITVGLLSLLAVIELITDQLPKTPSRKTPMQFGARLVTAGFSGAVLAAQWGWEIGGLAAAVVGAFLGTMGGYEGRRRLVAANGGKDLPVALGEDVLAIGGGIVVVFLASLL